VAGNVTGDFLRTYRVNPRTAALVPVGSDLPASFPTCVRLWT
jgi:hypothetical protein